MDAVIFILEALVVLGVIIMGTRSGGVGIGLWGGLGTAVLVFVFGEPPGAAMLIILAVVTAAALMQAAGGIDWMVAVAARAIERHPRQITVGSRLGWIDPATAHPAHRSTSGRVHPLGTQRRRRRPHPRLRRECRHDGDRKARRQPGHNHSAAVGELRLASTVHRDDTRDVHVIGVGQGSRPPGRRSRSSNVAAGFRAGREGS